MSTAVPYTFCQVCGSRPADRHHIASKGSGGTDDEYNILVLCRPHHVEIHQIGWHRFSLKYTCVKHAILHARHMVGRTTESRESHGRNGGV